MRVEASQLSGRISSCPAFRNQSRIKQQSSRCLACQAQSSNDLAESDDDSKIEEFEKELRSRRRASEAAPKASSGNSAEQQSSRPKWEKNQLVPEGWNSMSASQKATQLYMGERGLLFWINRLAVGGLIGTGVLWVAFRFVGPALGLYTLAG